MIPATFDYVRPSTVDEAVSALAAAGDDGKVIAGGQSLLPVLRVRLAAPSILVDIGGIGALRGVREDGSSLVIGAMTTHHDVASDPLVARYAALVAAATMQVGDRQIRNLGTFGGSLAHADPAADLPAVATALDATFVIVGPDGQREVGASDFFVDLFTTVLGPADVLLEVRIPKLDGWGADYQKFNRVVQAWAIVGVAATVRTENGSIAEARVALSNMGPRPVRCSAVESALAGGSSIEAAAELAAEGTSPTTDLNGSAEYRTHLARVLTRRALAAAAG